MADDRAASAFPFMKLPLEVRHRIYEFAAARRFKPTKLIRYWLEKREVKKLLRKTAPRFRGGPPPLVEYEDEYDGDSDESLELDDEDDYDDDDEDDEDETEDEYDEDNDDDDDNSDEGDEDNQARGPNHYDSSNGNGRSRQIIRPSGKWRHVPKFIYINRCPPPLSLLLTCKELHDEASFWFYNAAVLYINATASFAHTSFFEDVFDLITNAAFPPVLNFHRAQVTFVWDTTWLRAEDSEDFVRDVFPALALQRSAKVQAMLSRIHYLNELTIHWHDSAQDDESDSFMQALISPFNALNVSLTFREHYIAPDYEPDEFSVAGKRRIEFQDIIDDTPIRLF